MKFPSLHSTTKINQAKYDENHRISSCFMYTLSPMDDQEDFVCVCVFNYLHSCFWNLLKQR